MGDAPLNYNQASLSRGYCVEASLCIRNPRNENRSRPGLHCWGEKKEIILFTLSSSSLEILPASCLPSQPSVDPLHFSHSSNAYSTFFEIQDKNRKGYKRDS